MTGTGGAKTGTGGGVTGTGGGVTGTGGGVTGTGGATTARDGGTADLAGASSDAGASAPTAGCGAATWPAVGSTTPQTINVTDSTGAVTARQFYVVLPPSYDSTQPYRLISAWHYSGGTGKALAASGFGGGFYGVQPLLPQAIYVAGEGLVDPSTGMSGWPNTNGQDVAFARAMITWLGTNFCVDASRIMATGMSYGGIMSDTLGCQMPDVFRAVGVMSGALFGGGRGPTCVNHPIAAWITHGTADPMVDISGDETARDKFLADNHCGTTMTAVDPSPCVSYDGCDSGYPVVWCPVEGEGHVIPSFAAAGIANFFMQF